MLKEDKSLREYDYRNVSLKIGLKNISEFDYLNCKLNYGDSGKSYAVGTGSGFGYNGIEV